MLRRFICLAASNFGGWFWLRCLIPTVAWLLPAIVPNHSALAQQNRVFTYSYSNLLDGELNRQGGFTATEMSLAVEEALTLWSSVIPLSFQEVPDSGPSEISDEQYSAAGHPAIRIGHHDLEGSTLAHAFFSGVGGLASDLHFDSTNRTWSEPLFLTTAVHELGHTIGLDHIVGETAILNGSIGGGNTLAGLGQGFLFPADIEAAQSRWGAGSGVVTTQRVWTGGDNRWAVDANWDAGLRPSSNANVSIQNDAIIQVDRAGQNARSVTLGGGTSSLEVRTGGALQVRDDLTLGARIGGNPIISEGDTARLLVPVDASVQGEWFATDFDDGSWSSGATGFGFERSSGFEQLIRTDLESEMHDQNSSVYSRIEFVVEDPSQLDFLSLRMRYDDGFVAYLNGTEVASANRPRTLDWDSAATTTNDDSDAVEFQDFDLTNELPLLASGRNVLAIQGLNSRSTSSDMLISPELVTGVLDHQLVVDGGDVLVGGNLNLAQEASSHARVTVSGGLLTVRGDVGSGDGTASVDLRDGVLRVQGDPTPTTAVAPGAAARTLVPTDGSLGLEWTESGFDDQAWRSGPTGIGFERNDGFEDLISTDIEAELFDMNGSFYTRIEFDLDDVTGIRELNLAMRYDDGFAAYLNGKEIARSNAPNRLTWNSTARDSVDDDDARIPVDFDVSDHLQSLVNGTNVLAIHGLNQSPTSTDVLLIPELSWRRLAGTLAVNELNLYGGQLRDVVTVDGRVNHHSGVLSPSLPGTSNGTLPGPLTITGHYQMHEDAELQMQIEGTEEGDWDTLHLEGGATLGGTLQITVNENGGDYSDPVEPGTFDQIPLLLGGDLNGRFAQVLFDQQIVSGHVAEGLFRDMIYSDDSVSLLNYRAFAGDANGDGSFDSTDLVNVFQAGEYEDAAPGNSDWTEGDWNGDMDFSSDDFVVALTVGRYNEAPLLGAPIPEPTAFALLTAGMLMLSRRRRR